jgi:hypothetical protein
MKIPQREAKAKGEREWRQIAKVRKDLTFDDMQAVIQNRMSHVTCVIENEGEYIKSAPGNMAHAIIVMRITNEHWQKSSKSLWSWYLVVFAIAIILSGAIYFLCFYKGNLAA